MDVLKESKKEVYQVLGSGVASLKACVLGISEGLACNIPSVQEGIIRYNGVHMPESLLL